MAAQTELMALGMQSNLAGAIGSSSALAVTAAANNSATGATQLTADYNLITTSGASTNSVILPPCGGSSEVCIQVATGQTTVNIFPGANVSIVDEGAQGANAAAVTLAATKAATFFPCGNVWFMLRGA